MTLGQVEELLESTDHNGFPVVVSMESQYLIGFVLRRDLSLAIGNAKARMEGINSDTLILFTNHAPVTSVGATSSIMTASTHAGNDVFVDIFDIKKTPHVNRQDPNKGHLNNGLFRRMCH